jgi:SAM-dependent methyltransferase
VRCGSRDAAALASGTDYEYDTASNEFVFVRCRRCGHVYLDPRPSSDDLGIIYPSNYYAFGGASNPLVARLRRVWEAGKVRLYREHFGEGPRRILDVGCADGRLLELLREYGSAEWRLVGVDIDAAAVERCRARGFEAHCRRVEELPDDAGGFDGVVMLQLIEHVDDPVAIAKRVFSLLKPGGHFVVETPNLDGLDHRLFERSCWGHYHFPRHWHLFSGASLRSMLEDAGFEVVASQALISTSSWIISLHNLAKDRGWPDAAVRFFHYQNPLLLSAFVALDWLTARLGRPTSNQRVIARRPAASDATRAATSAAISA